MEVVQLLEVVEWDERPAILRATSFGVHEVDDEQRLLCSRALSANLAQFITGDRVALGPGVFDLDPILVPDSAITFQVPDGSRASLAPTPEGLHHLVLLGDGGSLVALGRDLLDLSLGLWVGMIGGVQLTIRNCGTYWPSSFAVWCLYYDLVCTRY